MLCHMMVLFKHNCCVLTMSSISYAFHCASLDLEFRLDYVLPSSDGMTSSYVNAIFSHTSYWASPEIALFLLSQIFPDYGPTK